VLDFLVRLSVKRLPSSPTSSKRSTYTLVPDGLQHPKFKGLDSRKGHYVVCRRAAMQEFEKRGTAFPLALTAKCSVERECLFSRDLPSPAVCHDRVTFLAARLYQPPLTLAYSARAGALGRAAAGSPAGGRRIPTVAETDLERILSYP
jgi:hypothetical protein